MAYTPTLGDIVLHTWIERSETHSEELEWLSTSVVIPADTYAQVKPAKVAGMPSAIFRPTSAITAQEFAIDLGGVTAGWMVFRPNGRINFIAPDGITTTTLRPATP
jgi:hypothetical protein